MKREYIAGHTFNEVISRSAPWNADETIWMAKAAIRVNGRPDGYAAWGFNRQEAEDALRSYLNPECNCVHRSDPKLCPVHAKDHESK